MPTSFDFELLSAVDDLRSSGFGEVELIGRSDHSLTFACVDTTRGFDPVTVKMFAPWIEVDEEHIRRLGLLRSSTIPNIRHLGITPNLKSKFFVMPHMPGTTLRSYLDQYAVASIEDAARWSKDLAAALTQLDELGIIHGDIKPENIVVEKTRGLSLIDWGLAATQVSAAGGLSWSGSPPYVAPEVVALGASTAASDIYSFGAVVAEMLDGVPIAEGAHMRQVDEPGWSDSPRPGSSRARMRRLADDCMREDPADRPRARDALETLFDLDLSSAAETGSVDWSANIYVRAQKFQVVSDQTLNIGREVIDSSSLRISRVALLFSIAGQRLVVSNESHSNIFRIEGGKSAILPPGSRFFIEDERTTLSLQAGESRHEIIVVVGAGLVGRLNRRRGFQDGPDTVTGAPTIRSMLRRPEKELLAAYCSPLFDDGASNPHIASHRESAEYLGISTLTSRNRMTRLLERLRTESELPPEVVATKDDFCRFALRVGLVSVEDLSMAGSTSKERSKNR